MNKQKADEAIKAINLANQTGVLLELLMNKCDVEPSDKLWQNLIRRFGEVQKASIDARKEFDNLIKTQPDLVNNLFNTEEE